MKNKKFNQSYMGALVFFMAALFSFSALASTSPSIQFLCEVGQNPLLPQQIQIQLNNSENALISLPGRGEGTGSYLMGHREDGRDQYLIQGETPPEGGIEPGRVSLIIVSDGMAAEGTGALWSKSTESFSVKCSVIQSRDGNRSILDSIDNSDSQQVSCCYLNCGTGNYTCLKVPAGKCIQHMCH